MIRKFAAVPGFSAVPRLILLTILMGAFTLHAQQPQDQPQPAPPSQPQSSQPQDTPQAPEPPAQDPQAQAPQAEPPQTQPTPATPQSSSTQEATPEESAHTRASKAAFYKKWSFNIGGGASLTNGNTANFVRGGGGIGAVGVAETTASISDFASISNSTISRCAPPRCRRRRLRARQITFIRWCLVPSSMCRSARTGVDTSSEAWDTFIDPASLIPPVQFPVRPATLSSFGGDIASTAACPSAETSCTRA